MVKFSSFVHVRKCGRGKGIPWLLIVKKVLIICVYLLMNKMLFVECFREAFHSSPWSCFLLLMLAYSFGRLFSGEQLRTKMSH